MARMVLHASAALVLVGLGWAMPRAQVSEPDFELVVDAPAGPTAITCVRGCRLMWVERGINPNAGKMASFEFACKGPGVQRCSSGRVGGWINP
jgi:hypothetical protein